MLCDICHIKEATLHYTVVMGDTSTTMYICEDCAKNKGLLPASGLPISRLLLNDANMDLVCNRCGLTFKEFAKTLKFGCSGCYDVFGKDIKSFLEKLQGSPVHKGKSLEKVNIETLEKRKKIIELKKALKKAIAKEAYETASKIRDELAKLENAV
ncbi:MAG: UvrB/UvrC motif-containing protein [candidate division WOR-3 bacterium]|nr:UvrB/UvrC motif-containing protein [candidate division WOR-3 bacterium]